MKTVIFFLAIYVIFVVKTFSQINVNSNTKIEVCFSATHSYVSDLGFYLVVPGYGIGQANPSIPGQNGTVELLPSVSSWNSITDLSDTVICSIPNNTIFNPGNDVNNLCFISTIPSGDSSYTACICNMPTPLTGTYASAGNWSYIYGFPINNGGWSIQIYDCEAIDVGTLTNAKLTFTTANTVYIYESGVISEPIDDNSCYYSSASTFSLPLTLVNEYFISDSTNYVLDTLYATVNNCNVSTLSPVDSAFLYSYTVIDSSVVEVNWIVWQQGIATIVSSQYEYTTEGTYSVYITIQCNTGMNKTLFSYFINTAINITYDQITNENYLNSKFYIVSIYPNPATNEVFIEVPNNKQQTTNNKQFKLFSIDGKKLLEGKLESPKTRISTKELESGVYFVEVNVGNKKITNKLVITR